MREVVNAVERATGLKVRVEIGKRRPGDPATLVASSARATAELAWKPALTNVDAIVESAWRWHQRHPRGYQASEFLRLLRLAAPYRGRLYAAFVAMLFDAIASASLIWVIKRITDDVLLTGRHLGLVIGVILAIYIVKGIGSYSSTILMTDVGQRVVRDVRNRSTRTCFDSPPDSSARKRPAS